MELFPRYSSCLWYEAVVRLGMIGFILSITTGTVHSFANNLIVTTIGCMTELDTTEVIMNNVVKSAEESDFPKMHLAVWDEERNVMMKESPYQYRPALGTTNAEITIVFVNPYTPEDFPEKNDLQFVIQLQDDPPGDGPPGTSAEFVSGGTIGCDGNQRVSARWKDNQGQVKLQIHDIAASFRLWAGWATGQGSVRLTPILKLEPATDVTNADEAAAAAAVVLEDPVETHKDPINSENKLEGKRDAPLGEEVELSGQANQREMDQEDRRANHLLGHTKDRKHKVIERNRKPQEKLHLQVLHEDAVTAAQKMIKHREEAAANSNGNNGAKPVTNNGNVDEKSPNLSQERPNALEKHDQQRQPRMKKEFMMDDARRRKELAAGMEQKFTGKSSFRSRYDQGIVLNKNSHFAACAFFVVAVGGIILGFGKRKEKGRRDL